jgi:hypothetical protein
MITFDNYLAECGKDKKVFSFFRIFSKKINDERI